MYMSLYATQCIINEREGYIHNVLEPSIID